MQVTTLDDVIQKTLVKEAGYNYSTTHKAILSFIEHEI